MLKTLLSIDYHKDLMESLFKLKASPLGVNILAPLFIFYILKDFGPIYILLILTFLQLIVFFFRITIASKALKILCIAEKLEINRLLKYYLFTIFANSLLLGISSMYAVLYADELHAFMLGALILALISGAMATLTPIFHAIFIFIFLNISILVFSLLVFSSSVTYYFSAFLLILYMLITIPSSFKMYKSLSDTIKQKEEIKELNISLEKKIEMRTKELEVKSSQLEILNRTLDQRVKEEIEKRHQNEKLMIQQSRQAAMGDMIGNIAHQWRQPLNALGLVLQNLNFEHQMGTLDDEFMDKSVSKGNKLVKIMSKTIDDFRNFFKPNKLKEHFKIADSIRDSLDIIEASFKNYNIEITINLDEMVEFYGYPSEFSQVILNILNNAKDALIENNIEKKEIKISTFKDDNNIFIEISDNAGGISTKVIEQVFEPYFTTKEEGKGTGIGLYMSKTIIETNMKGSLCVENRDGGANFRIILKQFLK